MRGSATALVWVGSLVLLGACQVLPVVPVVPVGPVGPVGTAGDPRLAQQIRVLRERITRIQTRLLALNRRDAAPADIPPAAPIAESAAPPPPMTTPTSNRILKPNERTAEAAAPRPPEHRATVDLGTTLYIDPIELPLLRHGAATLASLGWSGAANVVRDNWTTTQGQAHMIKILVSMNRTDADGILATLPTRLIKWGKRPDTVRVHASGHAAADALGYVRIAILRQR